MLRQLRDFAVGRSNLILGGVAHGLGHRGGERGFGVFGHRATLGQGTDFDFHALIEAGALPGDFDGFVEVADVEDKVAADGFFGFGIGAIGNRAAIFGKDASDVLERLAGFGFAFGFEAFEPGHEFAGGGLHFFGRHVFVPIGAAEEEHDFAGGAAGGVIGFSFHI